MHRTPVLGQDGGCNTTMAEAKRPLGQIHSSHVSQKHRLSGKAKKKPHGHTRRRIVLAYSDDSLIHQSGKSETGHNPQLRPEFWPASDPHKVQALLFDLLSQSQIHSGRPKQFLGLRLDATPGSFDQHIDRTPRPVLGNLSVGFHEIR